MEPIARTIKDFLGTLGFNTRKTRVDIKYDRAGGQLIARIEIEGPIDE